MNFYAYKAPNGNFGDDLNEWLWPKVFGSVKREADPEVTLIGIGSILDERLENIPGMKIVFGAGVRSQKAIKLSAENYKICFVRGPISAATLGGVKYITDPAILVADYAKRDTPVDGRVGLMPHYHSLRLARWDKLCEALGMLYLDPREACGTTLRALASCSRVICEAMHGAIVADSLGIPWARLAISSWQREGMGVSALKWLDWGLSCGVDVEPVELDAMPKFGSSRIDRINRWMYQKMSEGRLYQGLKNSTPKLKFRCSDRAKHLELIERCHAEISALTR